ncbi:hypothetical protein TNCV_2953001 [Trichonephila clavipes]|nr:hypothetical protein TNCV_2953001 [Trichonephila clavipes]
MSSFLVLCEGDTRNRWRDGQVCPDVDKELWRLGPDGSGEEDKESGREETREREKKVGRGGRVESGRENGRKESGIGVKKTMNAGGVENGNMN